MTNRSENNRMIVMTGHVAHTLTYAQIQKAMTQLQKKRQVVDPDNPYLWTVEVDGLVLWGILDHCAGPDKEDVLTLLYPEDY